MTFAIVHGGAAESDIQVGALLDDAIRRAGLTHKECWILAGMDGAQWSRMIHGEGGADLRKLVKLPWRFWAIFAPILMAALTVVWLVDLQHDRKERAS